MSPDTNTASASEPRAQSRWHVPHSAIVYLGFVLLFVVFAIVLRDSGFLTVENQLNILRQTAFVSVMAFERHLHSRRGRLTSRSAAWFRCLRW